MTDQTPAPKPQQPITRNIYRNGADAVYGLGLIGAAVYYIQHASTFVIGIVGVLKAIVWPAIVVYKLLEFLKL